MLAFGGSPSGTGTQTCSGDGDGVWDGASGPNTTGERFGSWQHLVNAGLIEGSYTGISGPLAGGHAVLGENAPSSKLGNAGWAATNYIASGDASNFAYDYGLGYTFGNASTDADTNQPALTPEEAWNIDTKVDDGLPGRGTFIAIRWATCGTSSSATDYDAPYNLSDSSILCAFRVKDVF